VAEEKKAAKKAGAKKASSAKKSGAGARKAGAAKKAGAKKAATSSKRTGAAGSVSHEQIAQRAYQIHERGHGGDAVENWLQAERELSEGR
jgi:hypothetical protein